jgi:putative spermidine/putrescine transport system permease protein
MSSSLRSPLRLAVTRRSLSWAIVAPPLALLMVFFVLPLAYLLYISFMSNSDVALYDAVPTVRNYLEVAADPFYRLIIERTLLATGTVLAASLVLGYPVAYYASRLTPRGRIIMLMVMMFPLMVSNVVRAYGWVSLLGRSGVVNVVMSGLDPSHRPVQMLYSFNAVALGLLTIMLPFMIVSITNSLSAIDHRYLEAAESLGASPWRAFLHVTWPLSRPGVTSGLMLVSFLTLSAYVTIALLGGPRFKLLVSLVFDSTATSRWPRAAALSFVLLVLALLIALVLQLLLRTRRARGERR